MNNRAIDGLYHTNATARVILDEIAKLPKQAATLLGTLLERLPDIDRREAVKALKSLEEFGLGQFIPGRKGHPSRFEWLVDSVSIRCLELPEETASQTGSAELIAHSFQLRADLALVLGLPSDLTSSEAQRLGLFLQSLPFER